MKRVTKSGFEFEIDEAKLDDMRLVDMLADMMDENVSEIKKALALPRLLNFILGDEQKAALYAKIAEENGGNVPIEKTAEAMREILNSSEAGNC